LGAFARAPFFVPLAALIHLGLAVWVFHACLRPGLFPFGRDTVSHDILFFDYGWSTVRATGLIPLWNHHLFAGWPWVAAAGWTPWYPPHWIALAAPVAFAFTLQCVLHHAWAGLGFTLWGCALGLSAGPALLGGVLFQMSGHFTTLVYPGHLSKFEAIAWMPWVLSASVRAYERASVRFALLAGLCLAMQILTQHAQIVYYTVAMLLGLGLWKAVRWWKRSLRPLWLCGAILVIALGLAMVQVLPAAEMKRISNRAHGVPWAEAVDTSYPPEELIELVWPGLFGSTVNGTYRGRWGERLVSDYLGLVTLIGIALALVARKRISPSPLEGEGVGGEGVPLAFLALLLLTVVLALGKYTPLYRLLYDWVPGWRDWRSPGTILVVATFAACTLAAMGWDAALSRVRARRAVPLQAGIVSLLILLAAADQTRVDRLYVNPVTQPFGLTEDGIAAGFVQVPREAKGSRVVLVGQEMSNTPMIAGQETISGYHPIVLRRWERLFQALGYNNLVLHQLLGVRQWLTPRGQILPPPFSPMTVQEPGEEPHPITSAQWSYFTAPLLGQRLWRPGRLIAAATSAEAFEELRPVAAQALASMEGERRDFTSIPSSSVFFTAAIVGLPPSEEIERFDAEGATESILFNASPFIPNGPVADLLDARPLLRTWPEPLRPIRYMASFVAQLAFEDLSPTCVMHRPNAIVAALVTLRMPDRWVVLSEMVAPGWKVWALDPPPSTVEHSNFPYGTAKFRARVPLRPVEVQPAWGALWAVKLRGGEVAILAEYRPATVRLGLFVTLASLAVLLALLLRLPNRAPEPAP
jgi:hypothetical protein